MKKHIKRIKENIGNRVLITGATSGIGKELALFLASHKFNLVLTGRNTEILDDLKNSFENEYGIHVLTISGDLTKPDEVDNIIKKTNHLEINIAIMNAGYGTSGKFSKNNLDDEVKMVQLNSIVPLKLAHHFANKMIALNSGSILFLSSIVAFQGVPYAANYAATKAYIQTLSEGLKHELKPHNINILSVAPGPVKSKFGERANMKMGKSLSPEQIVPSIVKAIGKKNIIYPGFMTKFLIANISLLPRKFKIIVMKKVMGSFTKHQY